MKKAKRKLKKLIRDPKLFFKDMYFNRIYKHEKKPTFLKKSSVNQYAIISAIYNADKYLDDYFTSIINQRVNFKTNIKIICIDDGSTDNTANVIKEWQKKYPKNIVYIYKENGGQGSARNVGLKYIKEHENPDWITFMDSDDFLDKNYIYNVDKAISKNKNISIVCCNQIYYFEDKNQYIDRHPLNYRFKTSNNLSPCTELGKNIQFSAALSFFRAKNIPNDLEFDELLKPTFEDGKFVNSFLLSQSNDDYIYFQPEAKYYNRKRADKSSTMDGVWQHKGQFSTVFERGYLDILSKCKLEKEFIPTYLQRTILWEMLKLVKQFLNNENRLTCLSAEEKLNFLRLMDETFKYIDKETIMSYELGNCGFSRQLGMLGCFKKMDVDTQVVYIDKIDYQSNSFMVRYFSCFNTDVSIQVDNNILTPTYYKKSDRNFLSRIFLTEHRMWFPIPEEGKNIEIIIDDKNVNINLLGKRYKNIFPLSLIKTHKPQENRNIWVLMDRDDSAGDNAEFFYDYLRKNHKDIKIYFVLSKSSKDWSRLKKSGFNLINHKSKKHRNILKECSFLISSQIGYLIEPFNNLQKNYRTIFLQHGVTKDDVSNWLNNVNMDLMITASKDEHASIVEDHSPYIYGNKEISLTGFPRFDSLYKHKDKFNNQVMILFTWRKSIAGTFVENGRSERLVNSEFTQTGYYQKINELFKSDKLRKLHEDLGTRFIFCPHPNMKQYINLFQLPKHISIANDDLTIHDLINQSSMVISDFSSIPFDFAFQNKPVCYYQFDKNEFFNGEHTYNKGYFDYDRDGFGPVFENLAQLLDYTESTIKQGYKNPKKYQDRIINTFPYVDDNNCYRVYNAITQLNKECNNKDITNILKNSYLTVKENANWLILRKRLSYLLKSEYSLKLHIEYIKSMIYTGVLLDAKEEMIKLKHKIKFISDKNISNEISILEGLWFFYMRDFEKALIKWKNVIHLLDKRETLFYATILFDTNDKNSLVKLLNKNQDNKLYSVLKFFLDNLQDDNFYLNIDRTIFNERENKYFCIDLCISNVMNKKQLAKAALEHIANYEKYFRLNKDPLIRHSIIDSCIILNNWNKVKNQFEGLNISISDLGKERAEQYLTSLKNTNNLKQYNLHKESLYCSKENIE